MPIPHFEEFMLPILKHLSEKKEHHVYELRERITEDFNLTEDDLKELLPSGKQAVFPNRLGWAVTYMKKAGLVAQPRRGFVCITELGSRVLVEKPHNFGVNYLNKYADFRKWRNSDDGGSDTGPETENKTPQEALEQAYFSIRRELADEIIKKIHECSPSFFERLVVELLVKMGYGGSLRDAGTAVGKSGDGGIDGTIKEDRLGLDIIYIQAKRWENVVGRPEIQKFAGALAMHRAKKGVFITTSTFSKDALEYVHRIDSRIVLLDGAQLAQLMIDYDLGVSGEAVFEVKRLDTDYFVEE